MKQIVVLLIVVFTALQCSAQFLKRNSTEFQISPVSAGFNLKKITYGDKMSFDQTFYWKKHYNSEDHEKTVYNFHSLYKRNSVIGVCVYGIDIDMMSDWFEKSKENKFRYWNKIRMGFKLLIEVNSHYLVSPWKKFYRYLNGEIYLSYLHLPHQARGDQTTKYRKGSFMLFALTSPSQQLQNLNYQKFVGYMKYKAIGSTWFKAYYHQDYGVDYMGISIEVELNKRGFNQSIVQSSRDIYRGWTIFGGMEFKLQSNHISLILGIKLDLRDH